MGRKETDAILKTSTISTSKLKSVCDDLHATPNGDQVTQFPPAFLKKP